ncbi:MAG TPA: HAD-IA family hydrolase [Caulobacteraceae bacterium]|nr:HAD-IA family hydrolase [Caulobacteraceae bacterium]
MSAAAPPFDAIVFDLGGVIVAHDNAFMVERVASRCRATPREVSRLMRRKDWGSGLPIEGLHRELSDELGYSADYATFSADWCCHFTVDDSMLALTRQLAAEQRVMLFSNTNQVHWDFLVAATGGDLAAFEAYLSHQLRKSKPAVEAFEMVARQAGIDPARSIFFDDVAENVEGARLAGFQAEVFTSEAALRALLTERGVRLD